MFLMRFIRMILSLPFLWTGRVAVMFQTPLSIPLLKTAWWISADGQVGVAALGAIAKLHEPAEAIGCALAWMQKLPRAEVAAYAGILAAEAGLGDIARNMHVACKQLPPDQLGLTELLEFTISQRFEPPGASADCARRLEARSDLSPTVSRMISMELLWDAMIAGRLDEVRRRATHVLAVGQAPAAHVAMAAVSEDQTEASRHLGQAKLPPAELHYFSYLAARGTGNQAEADRQLFLLDELNSRLAEYTKRQVDVIRGSA